MKIRRASVSVLKKCFCPAKIQRCFSKFQNVGMRWGPFYLFFYWDVHCLVLIATWNRNKMKYVASYHWNNQYFLFGAKKVNPFLCCINSFLLTPPKWMRARLRNKYCFALLMASHEICCVMAKCLILFLSLNSYKIVSILNVSKPTSSPMMVSHTINWK